MFNKAEICLYIWNFFYIYNIEETHFIPADLTVEQWRGLWGLRGPGNRPPARRKKTLFFQGYIWCNNLQLRKQIISNGYYTVVVVVAEKKKSVLIVIGVSLAERREKKKDFKDILRF